MSVDPIRLLRPNIAKLTPYSSARDEYKGKEGVFLDANENPFPSPYNRYPDPYQLEVKKKLAEIKRVKVENLLLGNGSDEVIDLIFRSFCTPGKDNVILLPPTYGMYKVSASINDVETREALLTSNFQPRVDDILRQTDANTKVLFICSPNNPSGNCIRHEIILELLQKFSGIIVLDEAYIDFCPESSMVEELHSYPNLIIMQTLSKAWGLAGIRMGIMIASAELIAVMNKIKPPYNINSLSQKIALEVLTDLPSMKKKVEMILEERKRLEKELAGLKSVSKVYPSDANFLLVKFDDARAVFDKMIERKVILRDRSSVVRCEGGIRITVGTPEENENLMKELRSIAG